MQPKPFITQSREPLPPIVTETMVQGQRELRGSLYFGSRSIPESPGRKPRRKLTPLEYVNLVAWFQATDRYFLNSVWGTFSTCLSLGGLGRERVYQLSSLFLNPSRLRFADLQTGPRPIWKERRRRLPGNSRQAWQLRNMRRDLIYLVPSAVHR